MAFSHTPVLFRQCIQGLDIRPDGTYLDGTAGGGGHSAGIAERLTTGRLIALDKDPEAVKAAGERLAGFPAQVIESDFADLAQVLDRLGIGAVDGVLLDLGVSSHQLDTPERGFSYMADAPLDMRMSGKGFSARDLINGWEMGDIARVLREYGEERHALAIAKKICRRRGDKPIETTGELAELIKSAVPPKERYQGGHPAKRSFQAIRIAVNGELDKLSQGLDDAFARLAKGGRLAVITFHSLEDRMVKQRFAAWCKGCICPPELPVCVCGHAPEGRLVNKKPITPDEEELQQNPRSHSAKLRVLEKL